MGDVLEFRPKEASDGQLEKPLTPAEVFIFPGVRIERRGFSLADRLYSASKPAQNTHQPRQKLKE